MAEPLFTIGPTNLGVVGVPLDWAERTMKPLGRALTLLNLGKYSLPAVHIDHEYIQARTEPSFDPTRKTSSSSCLHRLASTSITGVKMSMGCKDGSIQYMWALG